MGAKDSKPSFISYEESVKRVSDSELRRIREAFKKCAGVNCTTLSLESFVRDVLCDEVPTEISEWLYQACGGTKRGISFKDLLCGIVLLTKGSIEEKIKFLWTLYVNKQSESGSYLYKWDFARTLHLENTTLSGTNCPRATEILTSLFGSGDRVTFDQFRSWLLIHKNATPLSTWLLADRSANQNQDYETPTFYQSLAGVTHLEERDIIELEKCFWSLRNAAATGQLDIDSLTPLLSPPLPSAAVVGAFLAFDENKDGHIDFKELCCGLSAACRGPRTERLKFCFKIFDMDRDGLLSKNELSDMINILTDVANESKIQNSRSTTPESNDPVTEKYFDSQEVLQSLKQKISNIQQPKVNFQLGPVDSKSNMADGEKFDIVLTQEDFLIWSVENAEALVTPFLDLIFEVCHIVLGLRPQCKHQERDIVLGWLRRAVHSGYSVGQLWYLVSSDWWSHWDGYCSAPAQCCRTRDNDDVAMTDDTYTTNSTESMVSGVCDTSSVTSASSGVSSAPSPHSKPPPIDNSALLAPDTLKVPRLTGEGGQLRRDVTLSQHRDFELVPDRLWAAIAHWHGALHPLPRQVIKPPNSEVELELFPLHLKMYRHVTSSQRSVTSSSAVAPPDRHLAYTAAFSRLATVRQVCEFLSTSLHVTPDEIRLWNLTSSGSELLEDDTLSLQDCGLHDHSAVLLELRAPDLTWPEEISALRVSVSGGGGVAGGVGGARRGTLVSPDVPGATGLHNLGNTCFMNAALHAVWNTAALNRYFNSGLHMYELNTQNPLGTKGALALRYGELCKEVWSGGMRSVAPLRVRWCVSRWARLATGIQHDAQELLAWLLDALHEDLNRANTAIDGAVVASGGNKKDVPKPDQVAATEAWDQHQSRNRSIMTELFYGQLKSKVVCVTCGHESVRFDAYNMLSLPLPMDYNLPIQVKVIRQDGSVPIKYGVKVNSDATYGDVKKKLSELCQILPDSLVLVSLNGGSVEVREDSGRVSVRVGPLCAYEVTSLTELAHDHPAEDHATEEEPNGITEPAERSKSEIIASASPPGFYSHYQNTFTENPNGDCRSNTLPREAIKRSDIKQSPTLSVRSLNLKNRPNVDFEREPTDTAQMNGMKDRGKAIILVAVHRKLVRNEVYFVRWRRSVWTQFGCPLVLRVRRDVPCRDLYTHVWRHVARLLTDPPANTDRNNHAADCDDSLGYWFPFSVRAVRGASCARCGWARSCRGCVLPADDTPLCAFLGKSGYTPASDNPDDDVTASSNRSTPVAGLYKQKNADTEHLNRSPSIRCSGRWYRNNDMSQITLTVDWDPTALHLRYQTSREKACVEDASVGACEWEWSRPVSLHACLDAFTGEERLEEPYPCPACRTKQPAAKKLQIWRLPPVMIVHLKRFQLVNNKWIKSQKIVNFPFQDFDPTGYLAAVPQETILRHRDIKSHVRNRTSMYYDSNNDISESSDDENDTRLSERTDVKSKEAEARGRERLESTSLVATPVDDDNLVDFHKHHLCNDQDPFDLKYRLYAVVCHSGEMSGGHYVAYARNPSGAWLCYNDSQCRAATPADIDPAAAYLLFYERQGLQPDSYLPDVSQRTSPTPPPPSYDIGDLNKCTVM